MSEELVLREDHDGVTVLTLNRPERRNAWTIPLQREYYGLLQQCVEDGSVRAIVVTGSGTTFCPGADTDELQVYTADRRVQPRDGQDRAAGLVPDDRAQADDRRDQRRRGRVRAGADDDVRRAHRGAGGADETAFARRGLPALHSASYLLPRLIGMSRAAELLVSGRTFTTDEAAAIGLVHQIVPADGFMDHVLAYAARHRGQLLAGLGQSTSRSSCATATSRRSSSRCTMPKVANTPRWPRSTSTRA